MALCSVTTTKIKVISVEKSNVAKTEQSNEVHARVREKIGRSSSNEITGRVFTSCKTIQECSDSSARKKKTKTKQTSTYSGEFKLSPNVVRSLQN